MINLHPETIINLFNLEDGEFVPRLHFPDLPHGYKVVNCHFAMHKMCWEVIVEHESFPEIPHFEYPPVLDATINVVRLVSQFSHPRLDDKFMQIWRDKENE